MKEQTMNQQQKSSKILLLGDSCYDYYHYGTVTRISPEAPIPVFDLKNTEVKHGMAANVHENFKALKVDTDFQTCYTEKKHRYIDLKSKQQLIRVDEKIDLVGNIRVDYTDLNLNNYSAIVISDYGKGFFKYFDYEIIREIYQGPIFLDTKDKSLKLYKDSIVKVNQYEYEISDKGYKDQNIIVTYGGDKVTWNNKIFYPPQVEAHDVCGAGDTFLAAMVYNYLKTNDLEKSIDFAMKAATITVKHIGVYAPTLEEIVNNDTA